MLDTRCRARANNSCCYAVTFHILQPVSSFETVGNEKRRLFSATGVPYPVTVYKRYTSITITTAAAPWPVLLYRFTLYTRTGCLFHGNPRSAESGHSAHTEITQQKQKEAGKKRTAKEPAQKKRIVTFATNKKATQQHNTTSISQTIE